MNKTISNLNPRILLMYNREVEAHYLETYLKALHLNNLRGTNHVMTGVRYCSLKNVDIIIASLIINNTLVAERLLSKKTLLGIPIIFYTNDEDLFHEFKTSKILKENSHVDLILNPTSNQKLFSQIIRLYQLKLAKKTKDYFLAKKHLGNLEKVFYKEIIYLESEISYCKIHTKWGTYKITGSLTKLLQELGQNFIKIHEKYVVNLNFEYELIENEIKIDNLSLPIGVVYYSKVKKKIRKTNSH